MYRWDEFFVSVMATKTESDPILLTIAYKKTKQRRGSGTSESRKGPAKAMANH